MAILDIGNSTTTSLNNNVQDFSVKSKIIDEATQNEFYYMNENFNQYLGYYKEIPELKKAIDALAMWVAGKGWTSDPETTIILEHIKGWGKDTFDSIIQNMLIMKKVNGDAYAEIIRDENTNIIINIKPLNPANVRIVCNKKGMIIRYEELNASGEPVRKFKPNEIFHLSNDRVANEIHGVSIIEACKWVIDARNEAMRDKRRVLHRSTLRILYVDSDDTSKFSQLKAQYADAIKNGEVLILPKDTADMKDFPAIDTSQHTEWIQYLEQFYYKAAGVPEIIMGGSQAYSEASSKVGHLTFEQPHETERRRLEQDIWNQLYMRIDFDEPASLQDTMVSSEVKNTGQMSFQPNELTAQVGKNE